MQEFDRQLEAHGGSSNAYTSYDLTVYHEEVPSEALDLVIDLEADRMAGLPPLWRRRCRASAKW